jgi:hypothetical protein
MARYRSVVRRQTVRGSLWVGPNRAFWLGGTLTLNENYYGSSWKASFEA